MDLETIHKTILSDCLNNYVGVWEIIREISEEEFFSSKLPEWVKSRALQIIREMIEADFIEAGTIKKIESNQYVFLPLTMEIDEIISHIVDSLEKVGHMPPFGIIFWFQATAKGEQLARDLGLIE